MFEDMLVKEMDHLESFPLKNHFDDVEEEKDTYTTLQLRLLYSSRWKYWKYIKHLKHRCLYLSEEGYDELNIAMDDGREGTGAYQKR